MIGTLSLAAILSSQDRPVQGTFGMPTSFVWSRNVSHGTTFVVDRPETGLATILSGVSTNRTYFSQKYLMLLVNGVYYPFWEAFGPAEPIELKNGTYRYDTTLPTGNPLDTLHGYYTQRVASSTSHRDPWLTADRLWQHFSPRDGDTFTVTDSKTVMTFIGDCALQRQSGANFVSVYNLTQRTNNFPAPGVLLVPGVYRLKPISSGPAGDSSFREAVIVGGYKAP